MNSLRSLLWLSVAFLVLCGVYSCKTQKQTLTEYVYVNTTDTLTQIKYRIDSINIHDSIVTLIKGDTVQIERWHTAYKDRLRVDTVEKVRKEIVYQTKTEITTQYENRLYWWQKTLMWLGVAFFALLAFVVYRIIRKRIP